MVNKIFNFSKKFYFLFVYVVDKEQCNDENDDKCIKQKNQLEQIRDLTTSENIQFALSINTQLAEKQFNIYGSLPKLVFFRENFPVIYSGN